jgi:transcriptional regulator GlxA family with amidase domain
LEFCHGEDKSGLASILIDIRNELKKRSLGYYARSQSLFARIIIDMLRENSKAQEILYSPPVKASAQERLLIIEDYFESNYNLNVACLADLLHVSVRQLNRILKKTINMSYKQKALERRMEISKNLLKYTDMPINEIAVKVGYETLSNFSSIFRNKNGLSPSEYRDLKASHKQAKC